MLRTIITALGATLTLVIFGGCAANPNEVAIETERELAAAGFQMKLADTPEQMDHLNSLTQRQLTPTTKDGETVFIYADATQCRCLYVGNQRNYQAYERILLRQDNERKRQQAAQLNRMAVVQDAAMDWNLWGAWPRPIIY